MLTTNKTVAPEVKTDVETLIDLIKKLPDNKKEFVSGYVQGVSEMTETKAQSKEPA